VRSYRDTGQIVWAERAKQILLGPAAERYARDPHFHITWPEETTSNMIGAMWDVVEEAPVWTDEERMLASNVILNTLYVLPARTSGYGAIESNPGIIWNHTTFPLIGMYWMARWFDRYYGDVDSQVSVILNKCRHAFMNQSRSWKPQEDSAGYVSIVPRHTIDYTLAENDYVYFENGSVLRHAEYEVGFCDNTGDAAGFGDNGYGRVPYANNLHWALWYYRDGRFKWWLDRVGRSNLAAPFDPAIEPVEWTDLPGAEVFELHPEVYEYTSNYADYGGEVTPPNIPLEQCFDKIAFRESLDMDAEYFLLDGYSRGKHLQYDGNAIIKFFADGRDWLIDGDYLVRNTTDHNGVSVIRDGRVAELIPACASLDAMADLPLVTLSETTVHDFNGCDWIRNITWMKGEFVLVTDRVRANEPGDYTFVGNWKTIAEGEQRMEDGRVFVTERKGAGGVGSRDLATVTTDGVRSVKFLANTSRLDTALELPAGELELTLFARGVEGGSDSFFVAIDGGELIDFHIPQGRFGPSSSTWNHETPTPNITIEEAGLHRITVSMREGPAPQVDRILVRDQQGNTVAEIEAEAAPEVPAGLIEAAPLERFFVKSDGEPASKLTGRINHVGLQISYMRQRMGAEMQPGEMRTFHTIFYNDRDAAAKEYDVRRISDEAALVTRAGEPFMVVLTGDEVLPHGSMKMMAFTRDAAWGANITDFRGEFHTEQPIAVEVCANPPRLTMVGPEDLRTVNVGGLPLMLQNGRLAMDLAGFGELQAATAELEDAFDSYVARAQTPGAEVPAEAPPALPTERAVEVAVPAGMETAPVWKLYPVDLDGDGAQELIVLRANVAHAMTAAGETLWRFEAGGKMLSVAHADLDGDGALEVLVGSADENLYVLYAASGELKRQHHVDVPLRVGNSSVRQPQVGTIAVGDVDGDGTLDIIVCTLNGNLVRYDLDFNIVWRFDGIPHGAVEMELHDLDGDGTLNIVVANHYGAVQIFDEKGVGQPGVYSELGDVQMAVGDLNGDGISEIANGSSTGAFNVLTWRKQDGFTFPNYGFSSSELLMGQLMGDPTDELLASSETGYVYALNGAGEVLARRNLGDAVNDIALLPASRLAAACDDGFVYLLDGAFEPVGAVEVGERPLLVATMEGPDGTRLLVGTREGVAFVRP
jgi:outer membrane protein assembly factor BamB